ncbi:nuclear transport factor 2 family protein [Leptospira limi]|uniref:Nuclear transport factor 2 family protein n=1 Tax=Leptospira limi TaxID=2950023 RepID=A0ABT3M0N3_9LEPT|nr:nuclear transport factor 2 family protein [Leptospira limi]MCW7463531.1 nuclear transport factor 2 family protein [Leptospira limi]
MKPVLLLATLVLGSVGVFAKTSRNSSDKVLETFFNEFGKGNMAGVIGCFHENAVITAVRSESRNDGQLYGSYQGLKGVEDFLSNMGKEFDTKQFQVEHIVGKGNIAYASGSFFHIIKNTGKPFQSDWALKVELKDGKIISYHFYEDSASYLLASKK